MTIQCKRITRTILAFLVLVLLFPAAFVNAASQSESICNVSYKHVLSKSSLAVTVTGEDNSGSLEDGQQTITPARGTVEYTDLAVGTEKKFAIVTGSNYKLVSLSYAESGTDTYYDLLVPNDEEQNILYDETKQSISVKIAEKPIHMIAEFQAVYVTGGSMDEEDYPPFEVMVDGSGILICSQYGYEIKEGAPRTYKEEPQTKMWFKVQEPSGKELVSLKYKKEISNPNARAVTYGPEIDITNRVNSNNEFWIETCYERIVLIAEFADADGVITPPGGGGSGDGTGGGTGTGGSGSSGSSGSGDTNVNVDVNTNVNVSGTGSGSTSGSGSTGSTSSAKTGDDAATGWYLILMLVAAAAIIILAAKKKKNGGYKESE